MGNTSLLPAHLNLSVTGCYNCNVVNSLKQVTLTQKIFTGVQQLFKAQ
jgi:hypothetical protein